MKKILVFFDELDYFIPFFLSQEIFLITEVFYLNRFLRMRCTTISITVTEDCSRG